MKKIQLKLVAGIGLAQLALLSTAAHAQDTSRNLKDVVITATKANQKQSETGKVVTIISRQVLERSSGKSVSQLLDEQAGITINGANSNPGLNKGVYLRGADTKHTLILLDGVLAYDPSGVGGAFDLRLLSVDQIDHIEVMRGGQSTLYGSDAVAGVINIITKKDAGAMPLLNGVLSSGSYGAVKGNVGVAAQVKNISYNVNYSHDRSDGVSEAAAPPTGIKGFFDLDGYHQNAVNAQVGIKLTNNFSINPYVRYLQGRYAYDAGGFAEGSDYFTNKYLNVGANAVYKLENSTFNFNYSYGNSNRGYVSTQYGPTDYVGRLNFTELYYNNQINKHLKILIGLDNRRDKMNAAGTTRIDSTANLFGAYASVYLSNLASLFNLEGGGRYTKHTRFGSNWTYSVTPSINVLKDDKLKVFGTVSKSFKAPDLSALYGLFGANRNLKAEYSQEYEAGFSSNLFEGLNFRADVYKRDVRDAIVYLYPQGYLNQDWQSVKGVEVEPTYNGGKLTLRGYYSYLNGTVPAGNTTRNFLYRRPAHIFGLFAGYQFTAKLFVNLNWRTRSQAYDSFYNSATFSNELQSLKGYHLVDGYIEYKLFTGLKAFADVKNIFNTKYAELYGYTALGTNFNAGISFNIH